MRDSPTPVSPTASTEEVECAPLSFKSRPGANPAALQHLLDEHRAEVFRFACSICTDHDCAEDLAQRAFLALLQRDQLWNSRSEVRAFLFHVVRKRVFKAARRREARRRLQDPARDALYRVPASPEDSLAEENQMSSVQAALASLPPRRRQALVLAQCDGLSYREVAQAMKLSPQTVANHVSMALKDLRRKLNVSNPRIR